LQVSLANTGANATPVVVDLGANNDVTVTNATAANLKAEVTNAGTFAVQDAAVETAVAAVETAITAGNIDAGTAGTASADVLSIQGIASMTPVQVSLPTDVAIADDAAFTPATTKVVMVGFEADEGSTDSVDEGDGGAARMTLDRKQIVTPQPHTAGGLSVSNHLDVDESDDDVKASAGQLYGFYAVNRTTSPLYVRFYNTNTPTVGTTAHVLGPIEIPANASDHTAFIWTFGGMGVPFSTAISVAATTGFADNDTGAPSANALIMCILYK
jgi:hypothetical protein